jgi:hypothetical protein
MIMNISNQNSNLQLPSIELYKECYEGAVLVVSPLSTMNLEAGILGIPTIGLNSTEKSMLGRKKPFVSRVQDHLDDLENRGIMRIVNSPNELILELTPLLNEQRDFSHLRIKNTDIEYLYSIEK